MAVQAWAAAAAREAGVPAAWAAAAAPVPAAAAAGGDVIGGLSAAESALGSTMRGATVRVANPTDGNEAAAPAAASDAAPAAAPDDAAAESPEEEEEDEEDAYIEQWRSEREFITHSRVTKTSFTHIHATQDKNHKTLFRARYDMINKDGKRVIGPDVRVGKYALEGVGKDKFDQAEERMQRQNFLPGPWVSIGEGAKLIGGASIGEGVKLIGGACDDDDDMMHVDEHYHCTDGSVYNLLLARFPQFARQLKTRLTDDEFKRMSFDQLYQWFVDAEVPLQPRAIYADDMLAYLRIKVSERAEELVVVHTIGNTHCLSADTGRDELSDVSSGYVVAITQEDALAQLGEVGLKPRAMIIELRREKQPDKKRKRGKKLSAADKRRRKDDPAGRLA